MEGLPHQSTRRGFLSLLYNFYFSLNVNSSNPAPTYSYYYPQNFWLEFFRSNTPLLANAYGSNMESVHACRYMCKSWYSYSSIRRMHRRNEKWPEKKKRKVENLQGCEHRKGSKILRRRKQETHTKSFVGGGMEKDAKKEILTRLNQITWLIFSSTMSSNWGTSIPWLHLTPFHLWTSSCFI